MTLLLIFARRDLAVQVLVEMEAYLTEFDLPAKHWSESALGIWRNAVSVVKNRHRHDVLYKFEVIIVKNFHFLIVIYCLK